MDHYNRRKHFTEPHLEHKRHLPALEQLQHKIDGALYSISLDGKGAFKFASKVCCYTTAGVISDLNRAILNSLKIDCYSAAEALSRTSLENSINLMLFGKDLTSDRPKSMLLNYFGTSKKRARSWRRHAEESKNTESIKRSREFDQSLDFMRGLFGDLDESKVKVWPSAYDRFKAAGYEHFYHILFAPASDSTHGFSNDIFNRFLGEMLPMSEKEREEYFESQQAEKISFAYYLATNSILFHCAAASHIAGRAEHEEALDELHIIGKVLETMLVEHETLTKNCLDRLPPATSCPANNP
ncbi:TPA: DUF5677 domain-containing protein [Pseudomonas aeruginosa]